MENTFFRRAIIVFLLSFTILVITSAFYLFLNTKDILLVSDLTADFRDKVYLKDFVYKLDGTLKNNYKIDTNKVGTQEIKAIYQDKHGFYKTKRFTIEVKDVVAPTIMLSGDYTVTKGYDGKLEDDILCADDTDDQVECKISGGYNLDEVGIYPLKITAKDKSNNKTSLKFNLNVVDKQNNNTNSDQEDDMSKATKYEDVYKKYKTNNTLVGIDVSKWQKDIDFNKLKEQNVEFIFIKIAGQRQINGKIELDPKFKTNIEEAKKHGIAVGVYFYSYARSQEEARKQARYIVKNIKNYDIELPIVFDWENWLEYNKFKLSFNSLNLIAKAFMDEVEKNGYDSLIYSSEYYLENIWFKEDYNNIWIAKYGNLEHKPSYKVWQLCSDGKIDGIDKYIDIDVMYLK